MDSKIFVELVTIEGEGALEKTIRKESPASVVVIVGEICVTRVWTLV
jgi:hypothetical protein